MHLGKTATILSIIGFIGILAVSISHNHDPSGPTGLFVDLIAHLFISEKPLPEMENSIKAISAFDIYESNIRNIITYISIPLIFIAGVLSILSAFRNESSLWYSISIFIICFALMEINYILAGSFTLVCMLVIMNRRKWKLIRS